MVAGLITNGTAPGGEPDYLHELLQSGLDHVMILLDPDTEECWQALRDLMAEDIAVIVHLTLTRSTASAQIDEIIDQLVRWACRTGLAQRRQP
jgi:hypothetical protein